jgi:hypothetical protein
VLVVPVVEEADDDEDDVEDFLLLERDLWVCTIAGTGSLTVDNVAVDSNVGETTEEDEDEDAAV